jgi:hypothetical protein
MHQSPAIARSCVGCSLHIHRKTTPPPPRFPFYPPPYLVGGWWGEVDSAFFFWWGQQLDRPWLLRRRPRGAWTPRAARRPRRRRGRGSGGRAGRCDPAPASLSSATSAGTPCSATSSYSPLLARACVGFRSCLPNVMAACLAICWMLDEFSSSRCFSTLFIWSRVVGALFLLTFRKS